MKTAKDNMLLCSEKTHVNLKCGRKAHFAMFRFLFLIQALHRFFEDGFDLVIRRFYFFHLLLNKTDLHVNICRERYSMVILLSKL